MLQEVIDLISFNGYSGPVIIFAAFLVFALLVNILFYPLLRFITKKTKSDLDDKIRRVLKRPITVSIILVGLYASYTSTGLFSNFSSYALKIAKTLVVFVWLEVIIKIVSIVIQHYDHVPKKIKMGGLSKQMLPFIEKVAKITIIVIALFILMAVWELDISPLLASAGILSLAIAFAAKDTIANIFGGISVFLDKTYEIGHYIIVGDKYRGEVIDIGLRSTKIKTRDDILVTVPNSEMANSAVINESGGHKGMLRVRMPIGVGYGEDIKKVEKILLSIAKKAKWVVKDPKPRLRFRKFGEAALEFEFLFWVKLPEWRGRALSEMNNLVYEKFLKQKIKFGYTQEYHVELGRPRKRKK